MNRKPLVYLAGPYTKGDQSINAHCQCEIWHELMDDRVVMPYAPLLSHFLHYLNPRTYDDWMQHSYAVIARCDAILRSDAAIARLAYFQHVSTGADLEEKFAEENGIPVFYEKEDLYGWVNSRGI